MFQSKRSIITGNILQISYIHNNMEPLDIEKLANDACFSLHYQTKSKAQQQFLNLCQSLSKNQLYQLMNSYSQTVLFVTMEQLYKVIPKIQDQRQIFLTINQSTQNWYNTNLNSTLIRQGNIPLQFHVENSVGRTIGQCLKYIYLHKDIPDWIAQFMKQRRNLRYQLYLWKLFIETVSVVDSELTFLVYRSLVYNFQQFIIPKIMDSLVPYFQSVRQQIQINDLTFMQSHLSVSQRPSNEKEMISLFNPNQVKFTELVFAVLQQVICFNYNITYSEYESQTPIDNCLVCFPQLVTKKVANKQFISSIFFVAEKLINDNYQNSVINKNFLQITMECIQKIMLTKLFYSPNEIKVQFVKTVLICMTRLFNCNKLNQKTLLSLIQANLKFLINIQLYLIRSQQKEYQNWIQMVKLIIKKVISNSIINIDNQLVSESLQLITKIIEESSSPQLKQEISKFKIIGLQTFSLILQKLFTQNQSIIGLQKIRNYQDFKKNLSLFLKRIRHLCCLNFYQNLLNIQLILKNIHQGGNPIQLSNMFFLFSQLCQASVLQRNILYQSPQTATCLLYGRIMIMLLEWIQQYRNSNESIQQVQISIMIFVEKLLGQTLAFFTNDQSQIKITSQIYRYMAENNKMMNPEQFLSFCYNQIARNLVNSDYTRASYTFQTLTSLLLKFKWAVKRQIFKQTSIAQNILQLCRNLNDQYFQTERITLRKQLYRIIVNISFDDTLDDYRTSINQIIITLTKNLKEHKWKVMYDLTGICEAIDTSAIYRYFMVSLEKSAIPIPVIMAELFGGIQQASHGDQNLQLELVKSVLKLQLSMIENKGQRLCGSKNIFYNYKLIATLLPYWALLLSFEQFKSQDWDQAIIQLYKIFNTILKNSNTNFFVLERSIPQYSNFIYLLLKNMIEITTWVQQFPQVFQQYRTTMNLMSKQLMEVIFCNKNCQIVGCFNQLINIFMRFNINAIDSFSQGNRNVEQILQNYLQILKNIFKYLQNARKLQHKQIQLKNIMELNVGIQLKYQYMISLFKFGISSGKKILKLSQLLCKIIYYMNFLAGQAIVQIATQLGLNQAFLNDLLAIWKQNQESKRIYGEDLDQNQFIVNLRQWFKKCNTSTMIQPEY